MPEDRKKLSQGLQWWVILGGLIVTVGGFAINNFVLVPLKERMAKDAAIRADYPYLQKEVVKMQKWQRDMQEWKEQVLASGALSLQLRNVMVTMPDVAVPEVAVADTNGGGKTPKFVPTYELMQQIK